MRTGFRFDHHRSANRHGLPALQFHKPANFCFPASLIQSLVHAGESTCLISTFFNPCFASVSPDIFLNDFHSRTTTIGWCNLNLDFFIGIFQPSRSMPRSEILSTGISGSFTSDKICMISSLFISSSSFHFHTSTLPLPYFPSSTLPGATGIRSLKELHFCEQKIRDVLNEHRFCPTRICMGFFSD